MAHVSELTAVATYGRGGAGARVRVFEWIDHLGLDAEIFSYLGTSENSPRTVLERPVATIKVERELRRLERRSPERLLVFRQASPFGHGGLEGRLLAAAGWGVYDFDDGLAWAAKRRSSLGGLVRSSEEKCLMSLRRADRVIAGNDFLAEWSSGYARDVVTIPSCVQPKEYLEKASYETSDPPRLVWIGSRSGEGYLRRIETALLRVHERTGARLSLIGDASGLFDGPLDEITERVQWYEGRGERELAEYDLGLGPLTDDRVSQGKSAYKLLQYGAAALPFVASPVGTAERVAAALGGSLAASDGEWVDAIVALLEAPADERRRAGRAGRESVETQYSFSSWQSRWLAALDLRPATEPEPAT